MPKKKILEECGTPLTEAMADLKTAGQAGKVLRQRLKLTDDEVAQALAGFERITAAGKDHDLANLIGNPRKVPKDLKILLGLQEVGRLNISDLVGSQDATAWFRSIEEVVAPLIEAQIRTESEGELLLRSVPYVSELTNSSTSNLLRRVENTRADLTRARAEGYALRIITKAEVGGILDTAADAIRSGDKQAITDVAHHFHRLAAVGESARGIGEEFGRGLRSLKNVPVELEMVDDLYKKITTGDLDNPKVIKQIQNKLEAIEHLRQYPDDVQARVLMNWADMDFFDRGVALANEVFISSILGGFKTLTTNAVFPVMTAMAVPLENILGGGIVSAIGKVSGNEASVSAGTRLIRRELARMSGMARNIMTSAALGKRAWQEKRNILTSQGREALDTSLLNNIDAIASDSIPDPMLSVMKFMAGGLGAAPRFMRSTDEFVRQMTARGYIYGEVFEKEISKGVGVAEAVVRAEESTEKAFINGALATSEAISREALNRVQARGISPGRSLEEDAKFRAETAKEIERLHEELDVESLAPVTKSALGRANEAAATRELEDGTIPAGIQNILRQHPVWKIIMPFVKTPTNLLSYAGQRMDFFSPVTYALRSNFGGKMPAVEKTRLRNVREWASGDPTKRAEVIGRMTGGFGIATTAYMLANSGQITGSGPQDPELRKQMVAAGWQPYSIRTSEGYVSYLRADPFATFVGMAADIVEVAKFSDPADDQDILDLGHAVMFAAGQNVVNKTFLSGMRSFMDAVMRSDRYGATFLANTASGFVPKAITQFGEVTDDPILRDARGVLDKLKTKTHLFAEDVGPLRDMFGQPVRKFSFGEDEPSPASLWFNLFNPLTYRRVDDSVVSRELERLQHGFAPPSRNRYGIDTTEYRLGDGQTAYDRWLENHGRVKLGGKTIQQAMRELVRSKEYRDLPEAPGLFDQRPKVQAIQALRSRYREAAWTRTLEETPTLYRDVETILRQRADAFSDGRPLDAALSVLGQ